MVPYARPHAWAACTVVAAWLAYAALVSSRNPLEMVSDAFGFMERATGGCSLLAVYAIASLAFSRVAADLFLGLGYLVSYTALLLVPAVLLWPWVRPRDRSATESRWAVFRQMGWFVLAVVAACSPQPIRSTIVKGRPLWNALASHVYFGMFGGMKWGTGWQKAAKHTSIAEVMGEHPRELVANVVRNVLRLPNQGLVQLPFAFLAFFGPLFSLECHRAAEACEYSRRILLAIVSVPCSFAGCIAYCVPRYLLRVAMLMSACAAYGFGQCVPRCAIIRRGWCVPVRLLLLVLVAGIVLHRNVLWWVVAPLGRHDVARIETTKIPRADGDVDPRAVLANSFDCHDVFSPTKDVYATTWVQPGSLGKSATVDGIVSQMRMHGQRCLVFDDGSPALVGRPEHEWPVSRDEWEQKVTVHSPRDADTTVLKFKDEGSSGGLHA